jgi:hypothetical protein
VLGYSDYPVASLVNNLNLIVTTPGGVVWVGNQAPGGAALDTSDTSTSWLRVAPLPTTAGSL